MPQNSEEKLPGFLACMVGAVELCSGTEASSQETGEIGMSVVELTRSG